MVVACHVSDDVFWLDCRAGRMVRDRDRAPAVYRLRAARYRRSGGRSFLRDTDGHLARLWWPVCVPAGLLYRGVALSCDQAGTLHFIVAATGNAATGCTGRR